LGTKILVEEIAENTWFTGGLLPLYKSHKNKSYSRAIISQLYEIIFWVYKLPLT